MSRTPPVPKGEYAVGTMTYTVCNDRAETMYCNPGGSRSVPARVYYPVRKESVEGLQKAQYMSEAMCKALAKTFFLPINYKKLEKEGRNRSECYVDAPFITGQKFPLIIFNHGYISYREGNSYLLIELASQGYVVISVGHPYEALLTEFDDGTSVRTAKNLALKKYSPPVKAMSVMKKFTKETGTNEELAAKFDELQKQYCGFSIERIYEWEKDTLAALRYAKDNFADLIDFDKGIGAAGLSFGGATSYALCEDEPEFVCGINMDGGLFGKHEGKILKTPFLHINCETNRNVVARGLILHSKPVYHAVIKDMQHMGFSDMKHTITMKSQMGALDADIAHETVCSIHINFFDTYLKKSKQDPAFESNDVVTFKEYSPDE